MSESLEQARVQRQGLRAAIGRVERSMSTPGPGRAELWAKEVLGELQALGEALDQHIELTESPDGLLADIIEAAPRLAHRVDQTKNDHVQLRDRHKAAVDSLKGTDESIAEARDRIVELLTALVRHRHLGADLVYEAYNVDIEAAD